MFKKFKVKALLLMVVTLTAFGCGHSTGSSNNTVQTPHPSNWIVAHRAAFMTQSAQCVTCHGNVTDPAGGIAGVNCTTGVAGQSCHPNGQPPLYPHNPNTWPQLHRNLNWYVYSMLNPNATGTYQTQCAPCHGNLVPATSSNDPGNTGSIPAGSTVAMIPDPSGGISGWNCTTKCHNDGHPGHAPRTDCTKCHDNPNGIASPNAAKLDPTVTSRRDAVAEFQCTGNHIRTRAAGNGVAVAGGKGVTKLDCIVCHMEGNITNSFPDINSQNNTFWNYTSGSWIQNNPKQLGNHMTGYIELRDPQTNQTIKQVSFSNTLGAGETVAAGPGSFSSTATDAKFVRFNRDLTKPFEEDQNFQVLAGIEVNLCVKCHSATGATIVTQAGNILPPNATPQTPFGNQSTAVDVASQFASTNRSYHPVLARANNSYTMGSRMAAPWNAITKTNTATNQWGALMSCWDCHAPASVNIPAGTNTLLTSTVTAHGSNITAVAGSLNSVELRGVDWSTISGSTVNNTTFCIACHAGYNTATSTGSHGTGSAVGANTSSQMTSWFKNGCTYCHSTSPDGRTDANGVPLSANGVQRRARSADVHGFNTYYGHTTPIAPIAPDVAGTTVMTVHSSLGYAFIRNPNMAVRPLSVYVNGQTMTFKGKTGTTPSSGTAGCSFAPMPTFNVTGGSTSCSNSSMGSATGAGTAFTPGGVY